MQAFVTAQVDREWRPVKWCTSELRVGSPALMHAEVDALGGGAHGERHPERVNRRNGYRERSWDTRTGAIELALPKLRAGSYFPDWLLAPRKRSPRGHAHAPRTVHHPCQASARSAACYAPANREPMAPSRTSITRSSCLFVGWPTDRGPLSTKSTTTRPRA